MKIRRLLVALGLLTGAMAVAGPAAADTLNLVNPNTTPPVGIGEQCQNEPITICVANLGHGSPAEVNASLGYAD